MRIRTTICGTAIVAVACLSLAGCSSPSDTRQLGNDGDVPACVDGFAPNCIIDVDKAKDRTNVRNGTLVGFSSSGEPLSNVTVKQICLSMNDDVDASTCVSSPTQLPNWARVVTMPMRSGGQTYSAVSLAAFQVPEQGDESYLPLPATLTVTVATESGPKDIVMETACCDFPWAR